MTGRRRIQDHEPVTMLLLPMGCVDVVIPTFNACELIIRCLGHLTDPSIARVVVVDDASTDGTAAEVLAAFPGTALVQLDEHRGLSHALNRGAQAGTSEFILFLNNDVFASSSAVSDLVRALRADPVAASAGGRLVDPGTNNTQDSYRPRALPGALSLVIRLSGIERYWKHNPWTGQHLRRPLDDVTTLRTDAQPAGGCLMVRRASLSAVGGWDERYWFWYEDVDLSRRLAAVGPALYTPTAKFEHVGGASTTAWSKVEQHRRLYHGALQYAAAHLGRLEQVTVGLAFASVAVPRILLYALRRREAVSVYMEVLAGGLSLASGRRPAPFSMARRAGEESPGAALLRLGEHGLSRARWLQRVLRHADRT